MRTVVVEVLDLAGAWHRRHHVGGEVRRAVGREIGAVRGGEDAGAQEPGDAAAARDVGLQHIDRPGAQQPLEPVGVGRVLAGRHRDARRHASADVPQAGEVVGRDRFPEPADLLLDEAAHSKVPSDSGLSVGTV
jgi:hypothetical protein